MVTVTYQNSLDDIAAFNQFVFETGGAQRQKLPLRGFFAILTAMLFVALSGGQWPPMVVGLLAAVLVYLASPRVLARYAARQGAQLPISKTVLCAHTLALSPEGVTETTEHSSNFTAWAALQRFIVTPAHVFLFLNPLTAHVIPKAQLSESELSELVGTLERNLQGGAA